jgi:hypothetical protein
MYGVLRSKYEGNISESRNTTEKLMILRKQWNGYVLNKDNNIPLTA